MAGFRAILTIVVASIRYRWKDLVLTGVTYKIIGLILLAPLTSVLFRILLAASGRAVLSDQDILFFFLGPAGWFCFITIGALALGIAAVEQTALMAIIASTVQRIGVMGALRFAAVNSWPVLQVTGRMVGWTLLTVAPFLIAAGAVYLSLLTEYDINYYLQEKPPVFLFSLGLAAVLIVVLLAVLLRLFAGWFFALPLVVFEDVKPSQALRVSRERAHGHRRTLLLWILGWAVASSLLSTIATAVLIGLGRFVVPRFAGSLALLAVAIGVSLILWTLVNLAVNVLSTTAFASMLFHLYRRFGSKGKFDTARQNLEEAAASDPWFRFTRMRLAAVGMVGAVLAATVGVMTMHSVRLEDNCQVTAHRGSSAAAPENTLAAVKQAIADGADWVEIDVQETADGEVVVFHDSDFMKLSGVNLKIWDATLNDLKDIDIGSWFAPQFNDERVPTLGKVLDECKGKAGVNIELKYYGHDQQLEQRVAEIVEAHDMVGEVVIMSLKIDAVRKMRSLRPDWKVGLLMSVAAGDMARIDADFLAVNASFVN
ncbi:MAG: glycerophosphoryl diester phosphodiesterase membrane domain-containing protein, partial [Planctomycetota bacterium]|nr:glycerophosphoryl diester phosphodiesterase membrane domain-containing protein [Planctomycetota bacterium]